MTPDGKPKRIAILGMHLESNAFAPVCPEESFRVLCYLAGDDIHHPVSAESEKIGALQIYRQATTGLARAQGTILRDRNIVIEDVARLR